MYFLTLCPKTAGNALFLILSHLELQQNIVFCIFLPKSANKSIFLWNTKFHNLKIVILFILWSNAFKRLEMLFLKQSSSLSLTVKKLNCYFLQKSADKRNFFWSTKFHNFSIVNFFILYVNVLKHLKVPYFYRSRMDGRTDGRTDGHLIQT